MFVQRLLRRLNLMFAISFVVLLISSCDAKHTVKVTDVGPIILDQSNGNVTLVTNAGLIKLPMINGPDAVTPRVVTSPQGTSIIGGAYTIDASVKLLPSTIIWRFSIAPRADSDDSRATIDQLESWLSNRGSDLTLVLRDADGFTAQRIGVDIRGERTSIVNDTNEVLALSFEGSATSSLEVTQLVRSIDYTWIDPLR